MAQEDVVATKESAATMPVESPKKPTQEPTPVPAAGEKPIEKPDAASVAKSGSFKEESSLVSDLQESERKALDELKSLLQSAIANNEFTAPPPPTTEPAAPAAEEEEPAKSEEPAKPEEPTKSEEEGSSTQAPEPTAAVQDKTVVVDDDDDDDGAKTVEAIESTVVPVAPPAPATTPAEPAEQESIIAVVSKDVFIWGVPLLMDERSDTILLKFLRARDFKPKESLAMIKDTVKWRREFGIEKLMEEDLELPEMEKVVSMRGVDKEGHPVCYNVYGEFQNKELFDKAFGDGEKRQKFLRWRIQYLEKGIRELLDFTPGGVSTMVQVTDLKNSPGLLKGELRQALDLLQNNYPEFAAKQVFINVPWWYLAFNKMISPFLTQRTKSKFVFAGPSKSAETLFSYIAPEQVPVQFGGLSQDHDGDSEFTTADAVTEINMRPSSKQTIEVPVTEKCLLVWELRVLGWDVSIGAEFVPSSEESYTVIIQKSKKFTAADDEAIAKNSFKISEPGKVVLTVDNASSKKKKLLYRYKAKDCTE